MSMTECFYFLHREIFEAKICENHNFAYRYLVKSVLGHPTRGVGSTFGLDTYVKFRVLLENGENFNRGPTHPRILTFFTYVLLQKQSNIGIGTPHSRDPFIHFLI